MAIHERLRLDAMPPVVQSDGDSLRAAIAEFASTPGVKGIMALDCENHGPVPDGCDEFLRNLSVPILGGVFPRLIANSDQSKHGSILLGLKAALNIYVVPSPGDAALNYDECHSCTGLAPGISNAMVAFDACVKR